MNPDLTFNDWLDKDFKKISTGEWITLSAKEYYSALVPLENIETVLQKTEWDLRKGEGMPYLQTNYQKKEKNVYHRYSYSGIEPIIIHQFFDGDIPSILLLNQDFFLYFNLFSKTINDEVIYYIQDENGDEEKVVIINQKENCAKIKLKLIKKYLYDRKMALVLYFYLIRYSEKTITELNLQPINKTLTKENYCFNIFVDANKDSLIKENRKSIGMIMGKKIILPPTENPEKKRQYEDFIIDINDNGEFQYFTCNNQVLDDKNIKEKPFALHLIFFKKTVLQKYYTNTEKYKIIDGYLQRNGLWSMPIDNNQSDFVIVFLKDLARLPEKEQKYWKLHNTYCSESTISRTCFERAFNGEFSSPEATDLFFKQLFTLFNNEWQKKFGWKLWKDLHADDQHHFDALRIPLEEKNQQTFDELVSSMVKIFIDSLNETELVKNVHSTEELKGSVKKLENYLRCRKITCEPMIQFLRDLQNLRSGSTAHRKSSDKNGRYARACKKFELDTKTHKEVFEENILLKCIHTIWTLAKAFKIKIDL